VFVGVKKAGKNGLAKMATSTYPKNYCTILALEDWSSSVLIVVTPKDASGREKKILKTQFFSLKKEIFGYLFFAILFQSTKIHPRKFKILRFLLTWCFSLGSSWRSTCCYGAEQSRSILHFPQQQQRLSKLHFMTAHKKCDDAQQDFKITAEVLVGAFGALP